MHRIMAQPSCAGGAYAGQACRGGVSVHLMRMTGQRTLIVTALAATLAGCGSASDLLSRDAEWFSRPTRIFQRTDLTVNATPLSHRTSVTSDELVSADGACASVAPATVPDAASADGAPPPLGPTGAGIALDQSECAVVRAAGQPDNIAISANERGERAVTLTYVQGPRPGIYQFTNGRLTAMERGAEPPPSKKPAKPAKKKKSAA